MGIYSSSPSGGEGNTLQFKDNELSESKTLAVESLKKSSEAKTH